MPNIFFPKRKKKRLSLKIILFAGLFFCVLAGLAYFSIWSSVLQIKKIEIKSVKEPVYYAPDEIVKIAEQEISGKIFRFIPQNTIVLAPLNKIKNAVLDKFPEVRQADVYRNMSNMGLVVTIEERKSVGIWCKFEEPLVDEATSTEKVIEKNPERKINQCFQIDKDGIIYRDSLLVKGSSVLNIYSAKHQSAGVRDIVIPSEVIDFILNIKKQAPVSISDFDFISIEDVRAATFWGWQIYFNPAYSAESQLNALKTVLEEEIKENYVSLEYIDLRIQGRAYYK